MYIAMYITSYVRNYCSFYVVSPPTVIIHPNNITGEIFESVQFTCYTTGFEDFSFVWEHDGSVISTSNSTLLQNSIIIDPVLPQHQGQYRCIVTSFFSNFTSDAFTTLILNSKLFCIRT